MSTPLGKTKIDRFSTFDQHRHWSTGIFLDMPQYSHWTQEEKNAAMRQEVCRIRPSSQGNAIGTGIDGNHARWIVDRLNRCAELEKLLESNLKG